MMIKNNKDFLFLFDGVNTNCNGDPDQENQPRMDAMTRTMLVSDVRRKRDVRDFLFHKGYDIFVRMLNDKKVKMDTMFDYVLKTYDVDKKAPEEEKANAILNHMIDIRLFGSTMAFDKKEGVRSFTGPVQISWGYSLHPVDLIQSSSIVTIMNDGNSTFGKMYKAHYAMVAHSGTVNKYAAEKTRLTEADYELFRKALVQSMMNNLTHSKQGQQPLLYLEVTYADDFDGYLGDLRRFVNVKYKKEGNFRSQEDLVLDFSPLNQAAQDMKKYIKKIAVWKSPLFRSYENLPEGEDLDLISPITK